MGSDNSGVMVLSQAQARPMVAALAVLALVPFLYGLMALGGSGGLVAPGGAACGVLQDLGPAPRELKGRSVLVTGGAGYIGSHAAMQLLEEGWTVTIIDNLSRGNMGAVNVLEAHAKPGQLVTVIGDIGDSKLVERVLRHSKVDVVIHFAAIAFVGESTKEPLRYWHNITSNTLGLVEAMHNAGVSKLIYSSTCATYGNAEVMPITEETPTIPVNPYGAAKLSAEGVIKTYAKANPSFRATILRYFNVYGCDPAGRLCEFPRPELGKHGRISTACFDAALGRRPALAIFGTDFPTTDGTCVRDYIHVSDLVSAHIAALKHQTTDGVNLFNVGVGKGYSVKEFVDACLAVTKADIKVEYGARRAGDYAEVFSNPAKIQAALGWKAVHTDLVEGLATAWRWREKNPDGYPGWNRPAFQQDSWM